MVASGIIRVGRQGRPVLVAAQEQTQAEQQHRYSVLRWRATLVVERGTLRENLPSRKLREATPLMRRFQWSDPTYPRQHCEASSCQAFLNMHNGNGERDRSDANSNL
ncbi:hypothetical protein E2C01_024501 [Portunus trituberculatus]|uniref:Uncharacterized protein n=1 Tax=Portunus trituberculatus TaxID=210409 RepID=A0A5B7ECH6_PORTR|nr:hypothetical protein [Portunus trituberculatus]